VSDAREVILGRIARALRDVPPGETPGDVAVARGYREAGGTDSAAADATPEAVRRFEQRVGDYHAEVRRVAPGEVQRTIDEALRQRGLERIAVPPGLPGGLRPTVGELTEDHGLTAHELDGVDVVVTGCAAAIAETGTIVLDAGPGQGPRALTLVPDYHLVIVRTKQITAIVPDAIAALDSTRPLTWISGPSATSDIELKRVEGVHGPRTLDVLITD
jgi:L-lactate dehydrogenase complex protein LldG